MHEPAHGDRSKGWAQMRFIIVDYVNPTQGTRRKRVLLAIPLAAALFFLLLVGAEAHSRYVRSEPGQGAVIASEPERVEIWFTQDLFRRQGENWILVYGPGGDEVQSGEAQIDDDDRRRMWIELQFPLAAGEYRVEWRNLSAEDGDDEEGEFTFILDPQARVTSTPMLAETETSFPTPTHTAIAPEVAVIPNSKPTSEPTPDASDDESGCVLGLTPAFALVALGFGLTRRRR